MEARDIIIAPIVTEKTMSEIGDKKYTFKVDLRANKHQVRDAIEEIFDVSVAKVNVINSKPKKKRMGKYVGKTNRKAKAIVTLKENSKDIQLFEK